MVVLGDQWPIFLYNGYNYDPDNPWNNLFRSSILVLVSIKQIVLLGHDTDKLWGI